MKGHLGFLVNARPFVPVAYVRTAGSFFAVPTGAKTLKAWAVGRGGSAVTGTTYGFGGGGVAYKTWSAVAGTNVTYSFTYGDASITYAGQTITGIHGDEYGYGGGYSGSYDGGANGGAGSFSTGSGHLKTWGGAIGSSANTSLKRTPAIDVSGLLAAAELAGQKVVEDDDLYAPAFGSGGYYDEGGYGSFTELLIPGIGGGAIGVGADPGSAAVVFYFT